MRRAPWLTSKVIIVAMMQVSTIAAMDQRMSIIGPPSVERAAGRRILGRVAEPFQHEEGPGKRGLHKTAGRPRAKLSRNPYAKGRPQDRGVKTNMGLCRPRGPKETGCRDAYQRRLVCAGNACVS